MSSIESASMPGPDVGDKSPVDFGTKAVCLKTQGDATRLISSVTGNRSLPGTIRPSMASGHPNIPLLSTISSQKPATTSTGAHTAATYHVPRGPAAVANLVSRPTSTTLGRPSMAVQPMGAPPSTGASHKTTPTVMASNPNWVAAQPASALNNVLTVPRCISPSTLAPRTTSMGYASARPSPPITTTKGVPQRTPDTSRPLLFHAGPQKPVTITQGTQLHISGEKAMKVPAGSVTQVLPLRPPFSSGSAFIGQSQATILQSGVATSTVLTTPVRLSVSGPSQPPLLSAQRVSVAASGGTVLASRVAVSSMSPAAAQTVSIAGQARIPAGLNQGTIIATSNRLGPGPVNQATAVLPGQTRLAVQTVTGQNTILSTPARIGPYPTGQIVTGQPAVLTATARIASTGTCLSGSKPLAMAAQVPRVPVTVSNHQTPLSARSAITTTASVARFPAASGPGRTAIATPCTTASQSRLPGSAPNSSPIVVHPQIMVASKAQVRPVQLLSTATGQKVMSQPVHGPIQITQTPVSIASSKPAGYTGPAPPNTGQTTITTVVSKQVSYAPATAITTRPVTVVASPIPITKIFSQPPTSSSVGGPDMEGGVGPPLVTHGTQPPSVYIQTAHATLPSPGLVCTSSSLQSDRSGNPPTLSTYTLPSGASYYYEAPSGYQLATDAPLVARPLSPDVPLISRQLSTEGPLIARPFTPGGSAFVSQSSTTSIRSSVIPSHGLISTSQAMRFNPVMIVDSSPAQPTYNPETILISDSPMAHQGAGKVTASPRPSILRKRDNEMSPSKAVKNLTPLLSSASVSRSASPSPPSLHLETHQQSTDQGPSSNGSTTISATSSPGLDDPGDSSMPAVKIEFNEDLDRPPVEMSPRKKPRKQLLNDANDTIDMEFICEDKVKKEKAELGDEEEEEPLEKVYLVKKPSISLLHSYRHNWKSRHNHFLRYTDVKVKDERRPTVTELANQKHISQKVNGWKVYHLSTQMGELTDMESHVLDRLSAMLHVMDSSSCKDLDKDVNRVNDLIMGNIQRSKVIQDQVLEANAQMMRVLDHKIHVTEIISRCASKRNFKKREKY